MAKNYNQIRAMLAITGASLKATFRSPQSIFFSLFFPVVLIWIFGSLGGDGSSSVDVAYEKGGDTTSMIYNVLSSVPSLHFIATNKKNSEDELRKGRIAAIINVVKPASDTSAYQIHLRTSTAGQREVGQLKSILKGVVLQIDQNMHPERKSIANITETVSYNERPYQLIDF